MIPRAQSLWHWNTGVFRLENATNSGFRSLRSGSKERPWEKQSRGWPCPSVARTCNRHGEADNTDSLLRHEREQKRGRLWAPLPSFWVCLSYFDSDSHFTLPGRIIITTCLPTWAVSAFFKIKAQRVLVLKLQSAWIPGMANPAGQTILRREQWLMVTCWIHCPEEVVTITLIKRWICYSVIFQATMGGATLWPRVLNHTPFAPVLPLLKPKAPIKKMNLWSLD